jgi:hypothetical protein
MTTRRVTWRRSGEIATDELCTMTVRDGGLSLIGTVLGADRAGTPLRTEYRVFADGTGLTTAVHVRDLQGFAQRTVALTRDAKGAWTVDGFPDRELKGCTDVGLGCSPATITLPIRRLRLGIGAAHTVRVALVRLPELVVVPAAQTYTRLDEFTYRYADGDVEAEITVDDADLVTGFASWQRTGVGIGPEDTEPLDSHR